MVSVWHCLLVFLCLSFILIVLAWHASSVGFIPSEMSFPSVRCPWAVIPQGSPHPGMACLWAEVPYEWPLLACGSSFRVPLDMFSPRHLQQHISSCLLSHVPPATCLHEHLPHLGGCRFFINRLEMGCCRLSCLVAVLACHVLLSPIPEVAGLSCAWHRTAYGFFLHSSPPQPPLPKPCHVCPTWQVRLKAQALCCTGVLIMYILFQAWWTYQEGIWKSSSVLNLFFFLFYLKYLSMETFLGKRNINTFMWACTHAFLLCCYQVQWNHYICFCYLELCRVMAYPSDLLFISWWMKMQPQSSVKWYSCTFCQERKKKKKREQQRSERSFSDKTKIRTRLLLIKDWWRGIHCLQEKTFVKTIDFGSFW